MRGKRVGEDQHSVQMATPYPSLFACIFSLHDSANTRTIGGLLTDSVMNLPRMAYAWIWSKRQVLAHLNDAPLM
jgi:hypothetical protein